MNYHKCSVSTKNSRIVLKEKRSRFELVNAKKSEVEKVQVDGCLITDERPRCDWVLVSRIENKVLFIELKGCEIDRAVEQLMSTLEYTKDRYENFERQCFAVTTRIPRHGASIQRRCIEFYKKTSVTLRVKNLNFIESL